MVYILLYTLFLSNGNTLIAYKDARVLNAYRRIESISHCEKLAKDQEMRLLSVISNNSYIVDVTVLCYKGKRVPSSKPPSDK